MENNNHSACNLSTLNPNLRRDSADTSGAGVAFSFEALAPCLADLKRQLELRSAMH